MLLLLLFALSSECGAQLHMYGGPSFRGPLVRRSPMEALERLRAPVARYFPQVADYPEEAYALPPQWTALYNDEGGNEDEYEYDAPVYRTPPLDTIYPELLEEVPPPRDDDPVIYGDVMGGYLRAATSPQQRRRPMQRRSGSAPSQPQVAAAPPTSQQTIVVTPSTPAPLGQKEEPLFRPPQRTEWKSPVPMPKQTVVQKKKKESTDPLLDELNSLKRV